MAVAAGAGVVVAAGAGVAVAAGAGVAVAAGAGVVLSASLYCRAARASSIAFAMASTSALLGNVLTTDNGIDSRFYCGEVFVIILLQSICLGDGCIDLGVVGILVLQGSNRIFDSLCHSINFALLSDVLVTDNSIDGSFHGGEVLVVVLLQCICLGNGCVDLSVVGR